MPMLRFSIACLLSAGALNAAAVLDIDVAALRASPDYETIRALVEPAIPPAVSGRLVELTAAIGSDPRQDLRRIVVSVADDRLPVAVLGGIPTSALPEAVGQGEPELTLADGRHAVPLPRRHGAGMLVLDATTLALGPIEALDRAAVPAVRAAAAPIHLAIDLPADSQRPAARWISAVTADGDGAGHIHAVISARSDAAAILVQAFAERLRSSPPDRLGEAGRAALAAATVVRAGSTVTISADVPIEVRATALRRLLALVGGVSG